MQHQLTRTHKIIATGSVDALHDCLEHIDTPTGLVSLGRLLQDGPWIKVEVM